MDENLISTILEVQKGSRRSTARFTRLPSEWVITPRALKSYLPPGFYLYSRWARFADFQSLLEARAPVRYFEYYPRESPWFRPIEFHNFLSDYFRFNCSVRSVYCVVRFMAELLLRIKSFVFFGNCEKFIGFGNVVIVYFYDAFSGL